MDENVTLGMIVWTLLNTFHSLDLRQQNLKQTRPIQQLESFFGPSFGQNPRNLLADAFPGNLFDSRRKLTNGAKVSIFNREIQARRKAHRPDHPQPVLFKTGTRVADGSDQFPL